MIGGPIQFNRSTTPIRHISPYFIDIDLSFPKQREESDHGDIDPIQVGSLGLPNEPTSPSGCM